MESVKIIDPLKKFLEEKKYKIEAINPKNENIRVTQFYVSKKGIGHKKLCSVIVNFYLKTLNYKHNQGVFRKRGKKIF